MNRQIVKKNRWMQELNDLFVPTDQKQANALVKCLQTGKYLYTSWHVILFSILQIMYTGAIIPHTDVRHGHFFFASATLWYYVLPPCKHHPQVSIISSHCFLFSTKATENRCVCRLSSLLITLPNSIAEAMWIAWGIRWSLTLGLFSRWLEFSAVLRSVCFVADIMLN